MKMVRGYPPNYEKIAKTFGIRGNSKVIFTYGDTIYVPSGKLDQIDDALLAHEETHYYQQMEVGVEAWWERYLVDKEFRVSQEAEAYKEQYNIICQIFPRKLRRKIGAKLASDLSGPVYGNSVTKEEAKRLIGITE